MYIYNHVYMLCNCMCMYIYIIYVCFINTIYGNNQHPRNQDLPGTLERHHLKSSFAESIPPSFALKGPWKISWSIISFLMNMAEYGVILKIVHTPIPMEKSSFPSLKSHLGVSPTFRQAVTKPNIIFLVILYSLYPYLIPLTHHPPFKHSTGKTAPRRWEATAKAHLCGLGHLAELHGFLG